MVLGLVFCEGIVSLTKASVCHKDLEPDIELQARSLD
jgi:hypothetical protein